MSRLVRDLANLSATAVLAERWGRQSSRDWGSCRLARVSASKGLEPGEPVETLADLRFGRFDAARGLVVQRADMDTVFVVEPEVAEGSPTRRTTTVSLSRRWLPAKKRTIRLGDRSARGHCPRPEVGPLARSARAAPRGSGRSSWPPRVLRSGGPPR